MTPDSTEAPQETRSTAGMTTKVVKGSIWTLAGQIAPLCVSLITTPFVIRMLGAESYGVLILVGLIPTYLSFADLGMSTASTKFASDAYAQGSTDREAKAVRTGALIAFLTSFPIGAAVFFFSGALVALFNVPADLHTEAALALKFASITFVVNFLCNIFNTPQLTRLRMDLNSMVNAGFRILGILAMPLVLYLGGGIVGAVFVLMIASILTLAGHLIVSRRLLKELFQPTIDRTLARPMLKFGLALAGAGIASSMLVNAEKGILSGVVSVEALAYYAVAFTFASMITMFSTAMVQSLIPAFSQLTAGRKTVEMEKLFNRSVLLICIGLIPAAVFLFVVAESFFGIWAGPAFGRESTVPFQILLIGLIFNIPAYVPYSVVLSLGRTDVVAKLYWTELIPYLIIVYFLTTSLGIIGTALAWSLRVFADGFIFFFIVRKISGANLSLFRDGNYWIILAAFVYLPVIIMLLWDNQLVVVGTFLFILLSGLFFLVVWKFVLQVEERNWMVKKIQSGIH